MNEFISDIEELLPEEFEFRKKQNVLERLENRLAEREEFMVGFREELKIFEARYVMEVGRYYAELDEIEAEIAEEEAKLAPNDEEIQRKAAEARERAEASAEANDEENWQACSHKFFPTAQMKKAYYNLAKIIHPDLAIDLEERERRTLLMAKLNDAYAAGDTDLMNNLVEEHRDSPELIKGDSIGDQLVRVIRQVSQVKRRLETIKKEQRELETSEHNVLRVKVDEEAWEGKNLLSQMSERTKTNIKRAKRRLDNIRQNLVEVSSDEKFGLKIGMFQ